MQQQQQEDDGRGGDRRLKATQAEWKAQIQPPPTQKCPRCESLNTKFCYYNNYSFSQPRYFCKNCRRYWTQGGTLRNVRAGCGVRKGKRVTTKNSSSSCQEPAPQKVVQMEPNLTAPVITVSSNEDSSTVGSPSLAVSISPFYQGGGGFLASLAAIHSLNPSQPFDQSLDVGGDGVGGSSLGLLSGFMGSSLCSQNHQQDQSQISSSQFYQMGMRDDQALIQSTMANSTISASRHDWPQSFMNNANHMASDASLWSTVSTTSTGGNSESTAIGGSFSLIPNDQWPDLPGYDPPP